MAGQETVEAPRDTSLYAEPRTVTDLEECYFYHSMEIPGYGLVEGPWDLRGGVDDYLGRVDLRGKRVLEVGTFTGYGALWMALSLPADGRVVTCDVSEPFTAIAKRYWAEAGVAGKIELRLGPAAQTLAGLPAGAFDLAYVDADKANAVRYYEECLRLVRPGGVVTIDNTLWDGKPADPAVTDESTAAIRASMVSVSAVEDSAPLLMPAATSVSGAKGMSLLASIGALLFKRLGKPARRAATG